MCDEFTFMLKDAGVSVADVVLKHIEDKEVDVLVIAHKGLTYSYTAKPGDADRIDLGSTATGACDAAAELPVRVNPRAGSSVHNRIHSRRAWNCA